MKSFVRNPMVALPSLILLLLMLMITYASNKVSSLYSSTPVLVSWVIFSALLSLSIISFIFSGLISLVSHLPGKDSLKHPLPVFFSSAKKFWMKNSLVIFMLIVIYQIINFGSIYGVRYIAGYFSLELIYAQIMFFLVYFAFLAGILIFLTFSSFCLVIDNLGIKDSLRSSIRIVKSNYIKTLALIVIFFLLNQILDIALSGFRGGLLFELVNSAIIIPYMAMVFSRAQMALKK